MPKLYVKLPIRTFVRVFQKLPDGDQEIAKSDIMSDFIREFPPGWYRVDFCRIDEDGIEYTMADQEGELIDGYPVHVCTLYEFRPRDDVELPV